MRNDKKLLTGLYCTMLCMSLVACGSGTGSIGIATPSVPAEAPAGPVSSQTEQALLPEGSAPSAESQAPEENGKDRILVAYFSWAENAVQDDVDAMTSASVSAPGNVAQLAAWVSQQTGGDLFSIRVEEPYPAGWDDCLSRANQEKAEGARPVLSAKVNDMEDYDTVFLGYPNWWYSCPMAILSFLEENELSGKQVYLFCSHGTGGLASSVKDITAAMPESAVVSEHVFHLYQDDTASGRGEVESWLEEIGY